jgi:hypothetical protein
MKRLKRSMSWSRCGGQVNVGRLAQFKAAYVEERQAEGIDPFTQGSQRGHVSLFLRHPGVDMIDAQLLYEYQLFVRRLGGNVNRQLDAGF